MKLTIKLDNCRVKLYRDDELMQGVGSINGIDRHYVDISLKYDELELISVVDGKEIHLELDDVLTERAIK